MENAKENYFEVCMLGGFSLKFKGREYILGRNSTSKFIQLLQIVWLQGDKGVTKGYLMQSLYDRDMLYNQNNSFYNLIYHMRKHMRQIGLPKADYISKQDGYYLTDKRIKVKVDVLEFKSLVEKADKEEEHQKKYEYYQSALALYKGELLPAISTETWVMTESLQLKQQFEQCVKWVGEYLKQQRNYEAMYINYSKASKLYPFEDWQVHQIDALFCKGEHKEAFLLYERTVRSYSDEIGLPPSAKMLRCYEEIRQKTISRTSRESDIKTDIIKIIQEHENEHGSGAYYCSLPGFLDILRIQSAAVKQDIFSSTLVVCTIVDYEGKLIKNQEKLKSRSEILRKTLYQCLGECDAFVKYNSCQYLVLLSGVRKEECKVFSRRIKKSMKENAGSRAEVEFNVFSLSELNSHYSENS